MTFAGGAFGCRPFGAGGVGSLDLFVEETSLLCAGIAGAAGNEASFAGASAEPFATATEL